jgi:hypothetical protein
MREGVQQENLQVGDEMEDGTIYAGISPDTRKPMYAMPTDVSLTYTFNAAKDYVDDLNALDSFSHTDWRVPTKNELNVLYENRNKGKLKGTFNETGSYPAGWYWSSSQGNTLNARAQRFSDGHPRYFYKSNVSSLRCVR